MPEQTSLPLAGVRVIDLADGKAEMCGRILADLGADVIRVEPRAGALSRQRPPLHNGHSLYFAAHNANKRGVTLDVTDPHDLPRMLELADGADLIIETGKPGELAAVGLGAEALRKRNPGLVVVSITDFGQTGPYKEWVGTNSTLVAVGGELSRSGIRGKKPVLPPGSLAYETAAIQAAYAGLLAYLNRLETGLGDHVDCSVYEYTAQNLDPGFGMGGSATGGMVLGLTDRDRPDGGNLYPILRCADGFIRITILTPLQWQAMFAWLGEPAEFADPKYRTMAGRREDSGALYARIGELFSTLTKSEIMAKAHTLRVPVEALREPGEVLDNPHFRERRSVIDAEVAPGLVGTLPAGFFEIDGAMTGFRHRAPMVGEHNDEVFDGAAPVLPGPATGPATEAVPAEGRTTRGPLENLRVLDLGVIVAGAETGRLLADQGAEVIKIESTAFPDGVRASNPGMIMTQGIATGHRNKLSAGVNMRSPQGIEFFKELVRKSDIVLSNFKPGTMEKLGLGYEVLRDINPGIIVVDSSAFGSHGPWSNRMGYGPLIRAAIGLTGLWRDGSNEEAFCDSVTIYPDHAAARVSCVAILAALAARRRTGVGCAVSLAQSEIVLSHFTTEYLRESLQPGTLVPRGNTGEWDAPQGLYACAGDDDWIAVTVENDRQWLDVCAVMGRSDLAEDSRLADAAGRVKNRALIDEATEAWTRTMSARDAMAALQERGVPAGFMQRIADFLDDPQMKARGFLRHVKHPFLDAPIWVDNGKPALYEHIPEPPQRPAPLMAEHTRQVAEAVLGLDEQDIEALLESGALEEFTMALSV